MTTLSVYLHWVARGQNYVGMGWNRTDASNDSLIMARLWHIIAGIEIYIKKIIMIITMQTY